MARAALTRRTERPLRPSVGVALVQGASYTRLAPSDITPEIIGLKAWGLNSIPQAWTKPYFVVSGEISPTQAALERALTDVGLQEIHELLVRSSGVEESIEARGSLISKACRAEHLLETLEDLRRSPVVTTANGHVHWVIQEHVKVVTKGHLSNERRVAKDKRDWVAETEASIGRTGESHRISIRPWRDNRETPENSPLKCDYHAACIDRLKEVARWAYDRLIRVHFEWAWDGKTVYVVQADEYGNKNGGVDPRSLVKTPVAANLSGKELKVFRLATAQDFCTYRKLGNAKLYQDLGYNMVPFYVLDNPHELRVLLSNGQCSEALLADLELLSKQPLVIRTDGYDIPEERWTMLPRSDELRSKSAAAEWLLNKFRSPIIKAGDDGVSLSQYQLCLIAHHFVPAVASAWCQARPDNRRVRIESLWGIPEGLYWYGYDAFDVDTKNISIDEKGTLPKEMAIRDRIRHKEHFIAPDKSGAWVVHKTAAGPDWNPSIKHDKWLEEISWTSRRIAKALGEPVVVMWFVGLPKAVSEHQVLPWFHTKWHSSGTLNKAAPRRKNESATDFLLQTRQDWLHLNDVLTRREAISRVVVHPTEPELVRDPEFAKALAELGKRYLFVIELAGGILSHAYYLLSQAGCDVECVDLDEYATGDDEFSFNKLVRDRIPESIAAKGENVLLIELQGEALIAALRRKLVEEAMEVLDAKNNDQIAEELADVREVMLALMSRLEITEATVERLRKKKAAERGAFDKALMLSRTAVSSPLSMPDFDPEELLKGEPQKASKTISMVIEMPGTGEDLHSDKRVSATGNVERLFTTQLPAHVDGLNPLLARFSLETPSGKAYEMQFEIEADRVGADVHLKMKLSHAPTQLSLNLGEPDPD